MNKNLKIEEINYNSEELNQVVSNWEVSEDSKYLLRYPTVYIINDKNKKNNFDVYVGETTNIKNRTKQHLNKSDSDWLNLSNSDTSSMYVIGHSYFNKSLTLDIENRLMQYLSSVVSVNKLHNNRTNQQNEYYTSDKLEEIFSEVWGELHKKNNKLFPIESIVRDSAIFKASPFHKLTDEQITAKEVIMEKIEFALQREEKGQLIMVEGEAGSGKTVLMSTLFYELKKVGYEDDLESLNVHLLVNHDEHVMIYRQIASKLGLSDKPKKVINKPTSFILDHKPKEKVDIVIVDEAHLLLTQGKMSYKGKGHLKDLLERAKVVVTVFDRKQILSREQIWEYDTLDKLVEDVQQNNNLIQLKNQLRINSSIETINWIRGFIDNQIVDPIPYDNKGYDIKIFDTPASLERVIRKKADSTESGISRVIATFDWKFNGNKSPEEDKYWNVQIGDWSMPWNKQIKVKKGESQLPWIERSNTIDEVGSTFTIQGIDLNYAGVIIGPSVKYRNGKITFDKDNSENSKAIQNRTLSDNTKQNFAEMLLQNELNVLMTRGINGLYIYAVDDELRSALKEASKG
ncbi:DUF2075 domain-containing protein [Staphylococcus equorum]|uniref:DUF2075 domain-containing protein n=1 Tax=Staphylococcus equorum TaxID=246432 RepID=UPI0039807CD9